MRLTAIEGQGRVRRAGDQAAGTVLATDRGIDCVTVDYAVVKGIDPSARLF